MLYQSSRNRDIERGNELVIHGVRHRTTPSFPGYVVAENGDVYKGELWGERRLWFKPKQYIPRGGKSLVVCINTDRQSNLPMRVGEVVLTTFGDPPSRPGLYLGYRNGDVRDVRLQNVFWTGQKTKPHSSWPGGKANWYPI